MSRPSTKYEPLEGFVDDFFVQIADEGKPSSIASGARPFLKWVGGKRSILPALMQRIERLPSEPVAYYEPFVGGGALFFHAEPQSAHLSDINFQLVLTYQAIRDDVTKVIELLKGHAAKHSKEYYLSARKLLKDESAPAKAASLFIYLNKTCYNGLYRVNKNGYFNVPLGDYANPTIVDEFNLVRVARALEKAQIDHRSFWQTEIREGAFYYFDPPYHKVYGSYDASGFGDDMHTKLAEFCREVDRAGGYFMVSNSDTDFVQELYAGFTIENVMASRMVSCKAHQRGRENELLIRNYD